MRTTPPVVLSIAGFDPSGGAGIMTDLKAIHACGGYATAVISAHTIQNTQGVQAVHAVSPDLAAAQMHALFADMSIAAVKTGMLGTPEMAERVLDTLASVRFFGPLVVDPVLKSSSGHPLMTSMKATAWHALLRQATLITPNLPEACQLLALPDHTSPERLGQALCDRYGTAVLLKGGHSDGQVLEDQLWLPGQPEPQHFRHLRHKTRNTHGTGCALSSAIATRLAAGESLAEAVTQAIACLQHWLAQSHWTVGKGTGPLNIQPCLPV